VPKNTFIQFWSIFGFSEASNANEIDWKSQARKPNQKSSDTRLVTQSLFPGETVEGENFEKLLQILGNKVRQE